MPSIALISYFYCIEPPDMVNPTDVPLVPLAYQDAIVSGAICRMAFRQRDWIGLELWTAKYQADVQRMKEEYLVKQRQSSSEVKRSGYWNTEINYPLTSRGSREPTCRGLASIGSSTTSSRSTYPRQRAGGTRMQPMGAAPQPGAAAGQLPDSAWQDRMRNPFIAGTIGNVNAGRVRRTGADQLGHQRRCGTQG